MNIEIKNALQQIEESYAAWGSALISFTNPDNLAGTGLSTESISKAFLETLALLSYAEESQSIDEIALFTYKATIISAAQSLHSHIIPQSSNAAYLEATTSNIIGFIWSLKSSLYNLIPQSETKEVRRKSGKSIAILEGFINRANEIQSSISMNETKTSESLKTIEEAKNSISETLDEVAELKKSVLNNEKEIGASKISTDAVAASVAASLIEVKDLKSDLENAQQDQEDIFKKFSDHESKISKLLGNASQVALASSFEQKANKLMWTWIAWVILFICGILTLGWLGITKFLPLLESSEIITWQQLVVRLFISVPIVWFTWFCARQYSNTLKIAEDYAFKEASAKAFVGYRDEVNADKEMIKLLQESAIKSYSDNPAKYFLKDNDSVTPLNEAIANILGKLTPDKAAETAIELSKKSKGI